MTLLPVKVSSFLREQKVRVLKRKIDDLSCLVDDLKNEAKCDPDRSVEYNDHIEEVTARIELFTEELTVLKPCEERKIA